MTRNISIFGREAQCASKPLQKGIDFEVRHDGYVCARVVRMLPTKAMPVTMHVAISQRDWM